MKYQKSWKSISEQVTLLIENKGLECANQSELERALVEIGYYRLSAYWFPYKIKSKSGNTIFREGTHSKPSSARMNLTEASDS